MTPKITTEMREALEQQPGAPIEVRDEQTDKVYLLFDRQHARELLYRWVISELEVAERDVAAGRTVAWNVDGMIRQIHDNARQP